MNLLKEQISQMIQDVHDGNESPCRAYAILKELEKQIESCLEVIKDPAMDEARDFNKGEPYYDGTWEFRSSQTYLNFDEDETYVSLSNDLSLRKKDLNNAWKANQRGIIQADSEGEQIPVLSVKTPAKEGLIFKPK